MGANRRRQRRRRGGQGGAGTATAGRPASGGGRPAWRQTVDSFGGFLTIGAVVVALAVVAVIVVGVVRDSGGGSVETSSADLLGEAIDYPPGSAIHVATLEEMMITPGLPPVGGPHFTEWLDPGIYGEVSDGNAVHSLEHGMIWISYNPSMVSEEQIAEIDSVYEEFSDDVIVSERPDNQFAIAVASWGRLLRLDEPDTELMGQFVTTNRDRSPEPGLRGNGTGGSMQRGSDE